VKLACGEEIKAEAANGNGPVDAIYQAINRITGYDVELVKYDLNAKGQGKDALGQVDIVVNHHGRRFHGSGGDIAGAGLHAEVIQTEML
ncbi:alpha-isopropylmalate synthase regulatory domain-containing protein, partial [Vibrio parahaemolyticus]|uniref:alpha-isopropylmalate synthase regulatory domain-containing protein n=1 Tax=Vibrio parahaemolyticus TaxID=670 RepID=UPI00301E25B0